LLKAALSAKDGGVSLQDIEQLANFEVRDAQERQVRGEWTTKEASEAIDVAIARLKQILALGSTPERLSLLAGAYKRKAWVGPDDAAEPLQRMSEIYRDAYDLSAKGKDPYPLLNGAAGRMAAFWRQDPDAPSTEEVEILRDEIERARGTILHSRASDPDFWNLVMLPDLDLLLRLMDPGFDGKDMAVIEAGYLGATKIGNPREIASVVDQIDFLIAMTERKPVIRGALTNLKNTLTSPPARPVTEKAGGEGLHGFQGGVRRHQSLSDPRRGPQGLRERRQEHAVRPDQLLRLREKGPGHAD
jgi:hypothetical protein